MLAWLRPSPRGDEGVEPSPPPSVVSFGPDSKGSEPEQVNLTHWLDVVKPGYSEKFLPAFLAVGVEDVLDLANIDQEIYFEIEEELISHCGAKKMHLKNIYNA